MRLHLSVYPFTSMALPILSIPWPVALRILLVTSSIGPVILLNMIVRYQLLSLFVNVLSKYICVAGMEMRMDLHFVRLCRFSTLSTHTGDLK